MAVRREGPSWVRFFVKASHAPLPRVCMLVWFVGGPRLKIPLVCLRASVAMARRVATSEEASARSGTTLS
ncbi:hypothetical protein Taro_031896 [Colocasia esculenta]|uniref:Uncharacterized protein n=1 Tax=Colocasia esculenta TaxID=4460 RepID=A0A843VXU0_COLES|nr:hypothetical protein [Colocasia esculenta]